MTNFNSGEVALEDVKKKLERNTPISFIPSEQGERQRLLDDKTIDGHHTQTMSDMTRDELNARLKANDLENDLRLRELRQTVTDSMTKIDHRLDLIERDMAGVKGIKAVVITTAIASVIAIVGSVGGILAYGVSAFDSGRETSVLIQEAKAQTEQTRQLLLELKSQQKAAQPTVPTPPAAPTADHPQK